MVSLQQFAYKVLFTVSDEGTGFNPGNVSQMRDRKSWGLTIIQERAASVGMHLRIESAPGSGTQVIVTDKVGKL